MRLASSGEDSEWAKTSETKLIRLLTCIVTMSGFQLCPCSGVSRLAGCEPALLAPVFMTGLAGTLSEKSRACPWPQPLAANDCNHLPPAMHRAASIMQICAY